MADVLASWVAVEEQVPSVCEDSDCYNVFGLLKDTDSGIWYCVDCWQLWELQSGIISPAASKKAKPAPVQQDQLEEPPPQPSAAALDQDVSTTNAVQPITIEVTAEPIEVTAGGTLDLQDQCERNPLCLRGSRHRGKCRTTSRKDPGRTSCVACSNRRVIDPDSNGRCRDCAGTRKGHYWQPAKFPEWANAQVGKCNECRRKKRKVLHGLCHDCTSVTAGDGGGGTRRVQLSPEDLTVLSFLV